VELSAADISRFHQELLASGVTPSRLLKIHRVLSRSLRIASKLGYVDRNVATLVSPPRVEEKEPSFLTSNQVSTLLDSIRDSKNEARWLLALLGLRQGEVLGLPWDAVDLDTGELRVKQALQRQSGAGLKIVPPKSRSSRRTVLLPEQVVEALKARRLDQIADKLKCGPAWVNECDLVFTSPTGLPIDPSADHKAWKSLLLSADIKVMRLHDARHTAATLLLRSGVSTRAAMEWLGHSQVSQTMRYTHVLPEVARDTSSRMGKAMFGDS
jgi:integrase